MKKKPYKNRKLPESEKSLASESESESSKEGTELVESGRKNTKPNY